MEVKQGYKQTELGIIPEEWSVKSIDQIFSFYSTSNYSKAQMTLEGDVGCLHYGLIHAIKNSFYNVKSGIKYYVNMKQAKYEFVVNGDIVMVDASEDLSGVNKSVEITGIGNKLYISGLHTFLLRDRGFLAEYFRGAILNSNIAKTQMLRLAVGMKVYGVSRPQIKTVLLPVPPFPEQTAIANALSDMDALISQTEKLIEKKKAIKQGVMQELLKPKEGWVKVTLGSVINVSRGGSPRPIQDFLTSDADGINWIKIGDTDIESKYINSANEKIIPEGEKNSRKVNVGDFLLSNSMSFGRPYILNIDGCIHDGWLVLQNYDAHFDQEFLYYSLMSSYVLKQYLRLAAGSGVLNLNKEIVKGVQLLKPRDLNEQRAIADILSTMDKDIDLQIIKLNKLKQQKQGMMQALLTGKIRLVS
jgi:type I restriction enzyme S subunit